MPPTEYNPFAPHDVDEDTQEIEKVEDPEDTGSETPAGDEDQQTEAPNDGTVPEVLENVGDDPEKAAEALEAEQSEEEPRKTLVEKLEPLAEEAVPDGNADELIAWVGDDKERAQRAFDAEQAKDKPRKGVTNALNEIISAEG